MGNLVDLTKSGGKGRVCGDCKVCCSTHGIRELDKPSMIRCKHVCDKGCGIYEDRPGECAGYQCAWLQGVFEDRDRPDLNGYVIEMQDTVVGWTWVAHEYIGHKRRGRDLLNELKTTKYPLVIVPRIGPRKIFTDDPKLRRKISEVLRKSKGKIDYTN